MKKLIYIDHFTPYNSNSYWLEAFKRQFEEVINLEILAHTIPNLIEIIKFQKPDMIHFGGSIKKEKGIPIEFYKTIRQLLPNVRMTAFYGDVYHTEYNNLRLKYIDCLYASSYTHVTFENSHYSPCPIKKEWLSDINTPKKYDIVFCGNNYSPYRNSVLKKLDQKYNLHIWGDGWRGFKNNHGICTIEQSLEHYRGAKIILADVVGDYCRHSHVDNRCNLNYSNYFQNKVCRNYQCPHFQPHIMYFSNRMIVSLASGTPVVSSYRAGMELMLDNYENIVWYNNINEIDSILKTLLANESDRERIGNKGKIFASNYTFDDLIRKLKGEKA